MVGKANQEWNSPSCFLGKQLAEVEGGGGRGKETCDGKKRKDGSAQEGGEGKTNVALSFIRHVLAPKRRLGVGWWWRWRRKRMRMRRK